jgi:Uma2 family endonuclease
MQAILVIVTEMNWQPLIKPPPSVRELITDDGMPMESNRHVLQMIFLREVLEYAWAGRNDFFVGTNMFLYYSTLQTKRNDFRGPDVFVVLGTEHRDREAWVIWEEDGKHPDVVIELTSESTRSYDRGEKKRIYGELIGVPEYFIFDPIRGDLEGYRLNAGKLAYQPLQPSSAGRFDSERLGLELGPWIGSYSDFPGKWLRWYRPDGSLLLTAREAQAEEARLRAEEARLRADAEERARAAEKRATELERRLAELERLQGTPGANE